MKHDQLCKVQFNFERICSINDEGSLIHVSTLCASVFPIESDEINKVINEGNFTNRYG